MHIESFLSAESIAAAASAESDVVAFGHRFTEAVLAVDVNVGAGVELVTLIVYGRTNGGSWRALHVVDLSTAGGDLVSSKAFTADFARENAILIPTAVDELKVAAANTGANTAVVTVTGSFR
jgi:hypothetical protein